MKKSLLLAMILSVFFLLSASAWSAPVPDTGQAKCYDNSAEITCPSPGQDFYGQDAQYITSPQSYTKLDGNGNDLPESASEWIMIRDSVTGLIWENKTVDGTIHDKDNMYSWYDAQDVFIATLNNDNFGGYSDWRLPTPKELAALVSRDTYVPAINTIYFPNTVSTYYWTANTIANFPDNAWYVDFSEGGVNDYGKSYGYCVRAVRGGQCGPFGNFIDNGDETVTDTSTGLMWQKDTAPGTYTWQEALVYCENLSFAGYNDWRLPSVNELQSLVDYSCYSPAIDAAFFPNTSLSYYWSSSSSGPHFPHYAWLITFENGTVREDLKDLYDSVRAVRGGMRRVPDTGQTKCYDNSQEITCPQPGQPFYGQDSQYGINVQSFTKLDANGNDLPASATEWIMIRDNVTGLIWENKTDDGSIHDKDNNYNWYDAQDEFIATLNNGNFGVHNDWRLPTIKELLSVVDRDRISPSISITHFLNTISSHYWSSTPYRSDPSNVWVVNFYDGYVMEGGKAKNESYYVRAVRGEQYGASNYYINTGAKTVADITTNLMWQKDTVLGPFNWQQALSYCENLSLVGYDDWRLPNVNELQCLVDYDQENPAIDTSFFPNAAAYCWSSTTWAHQPYVAWFVGFNNGSVGDGNKEGLAESPIRAVRTIGDYDSDCIGDVTDNCPVHQNSQSQGTCVREVSGVVLSYGEELTPPPIFIPCTSDEECTAQGAYCDLNQGDFNGNGIGDVCECYADCDCDNKVNLTDLVCLKVCFLDPDCQTNPCGGDFNDDGKCDLSDLVIIKIQFLRTDCPACP